MIIATLDVQLTFQLFSKKTVRGAPRELNYRAMIQSLIIRIVEHFPTINENRVIDLAYLRQSRCPCVKPIVYAIISPIGLRYLKGNHGLSKGQVSDSLRAFLMVLIP